MPPDTVIIAPPSWTEVLPLDHAFAANTSGGDCPSGAVARKPLWVDLGCGKGRFLLAMAHRNPAMDFLGVDRLLVRIRKVERKIVRAGLTNTRLLRAEAFYAVRYLLPPQSVSTFTIFFPDPWPKRRHHRRRLFTPVFLDALHQALAPAGVVQIATDDADYFQAIAKLFRFDPRFIEAPLLEPDQDARTDFEVIFLQQGAPIWRAAYCRP